MAIDVKAIRERVEAATDTAKPPWAATITGVVYDDRGHAVHAIPNHPLHLSDVDRPSVRDDEAIAAFVAHAPADIQALLAEVVRQAAEIERLQEALPDPDKLETLADWLDIKDAEDGREGVEVQMDLRRWARQAREAKAERRGKEGG